MLDLNHQFRNTLNQNPNHHANYRYRSNGAAGGVQFRLETMEEDSGVCSPPLWRNSSPPDSPVRFPNSRALSPASRAQAIARGQREMMEMVENMPETSYELSLKDIVEQRREYTDVSVDETQSMEEGERRLISDGGEENQRRRKNKKGGMRRQESSKTGRIIVRNESMNQNKGLLINMFFPFSLGSKKKKSSSIRTNSYSRNSFNRGAGLKSSPRAELLDKSGGGGGDGGGDRRDWWKRVTDSESLGITSSSGGESTGRSGSSGSSTASSLRNNSDRGENDCTQGCWSLFTCRKKKP